MLRGERYDLTRSTEGLREPSEHHEVVLKLNFRQPTHTERDGSGHLSPRSTRSIVGDRLSTTGPEVGAEGSL